LAGWVTRVGELVLTVTLTKANPASNPGNG
jgi:hypothetical protein